MDVLESVIPGETGIGTPIKILGGDALGAGLIGCILMVLPLLRLFHAFIRVRKAQRLCMGERKGS
jgi:hypothetical protein